MNVRELLKTHHINLIGTGPRWKSVSVHMMDKERFIPVHWEMIHLFLGGSTSRPFIFSINTLIIRPTSSRMGHGIGGYLPIGKTAVASDEKGRTDRWGN